MTIDTQFTGPFQGALVPRFELAKGDLPDAVAERILDALPLKDIQRLFYTNRKWNHHVRKYLGSFCHRKMHELFYFVPQIKLIAKKAFALEAKEKTFSKNGEVHLDSASRKAAFEKMKRLTGLMGVENLMLSLEGCSEEMRERSLQTLTQLYEKHTASKEVDPEYDMDHLFTALFKESSQQFRSMEALYNQASQLLQEWFELVADPSGDVSQEEFQRVNEDLQARQNELKALPTFKHADLVASQLLSMHHLDPFEVSFICNQLLVCIRCGIEEGSYARFLELLAPIVLKLERDQPLSQKDQYTLINLIKIFSLLREYECEFKQHPALDQLGERLLNGASKNAKELVKDGFETLDQLWSICSGRAEEPDPEDSLGIAFYNLFEAVYPVTNHADIPKGAVEFILFVLILMAIYPTL